MIYKNRVLLSYLTYLTLVGQDDSGRLEWVGSNTDWFDAKANSMTPSELIACEELRASDDYDLSTCHK